MELTVQPGNISVTMSEVQVCTTMSAVLGSVYSFEHLNPKIWSRDEPPLVNAAENESQVFLALSYITTTDL